MFSLAQTKPGVRIPAGFLFVKLRFVQRLFQVSSLCERGGDQHVRMSDVDEKFAKGVECDTKETHSLMYPNV